MRPRLDHLPRQPARLRDPGDPSALQPSLVQGPYDVPPDLELPEPGLQIRRQSKSPPFPRGQTESFQGAKPSPCQSRPGVRRAHPVIHPALLVRRRQQPSIQDREPVRLVLSPDPALGIQARQIAEAFLGGLLGPRAQSVADVVPWNDEVATVIATPPNQDMGVRLVRIEMTGRDPCQSGSSQIRPDPPHDVAHIVLQVPYALPVLGRNDQTKMVTILPPRPDRRARIQAIDLAVEEGGPLAVIGGGLAGLSVCRRLAESGRDFVLIEARDRLGGRLFSCDEQGLPADDGFDLGASWFWPEAQPDLAALVKALGLETFAQAGNEGDLLFERMSREKPQRCRPVDFQGQALRIAGGNTALVRALAKALPQDRLLTSFRACGLSLAGETITVALQSDLGGESRLSASHVVLALPPRLMAAGMSFAPPMDQPILDRWRAVPTWMAPHAKVFALYDAPFWRRDGLSGTAQSMVGPMAEVHDATTASGKAALFGFVAAGPDQRAAWGEDRLKDACLTQLERLFGPQARSPRAVILKDWAADPLTATADDRSAQNPFEGDDVPWVSPPWSDRLFLAGSETSPRDPGYLAGAVEAAARAAAAVIACS